MIPNVWGFYHRSVFAPHTVRMFGTEYESFSNIEIKTNVLAFIGPLCLRFGPSPNERSDVTAAK